MTSQNEGDNKASKISNDMHISWSDLEIAEKYNSEHRPRVLKWLKDYLGYLPHEGAYMPYMALAQSIIKNAVEGVIAPDIASDEFFKLAICIRRDDMHKGDWVNDKFDDANKIRYETQLKEHKQKARQRLCDFLCEEIPVEYSFLSEIFLRHIMAFDDYYDGMNYGSFDMKAGTIALYRQAYQTLGQEAADDLPLINLVYSYDNPHGQLEED